MPDNPRATLPPLLLVRPPADVQVPGFEPELYARLRHSRADSIGANLRFKNPDMAATNRVARRLQWGTRQ